ncbi:hypothetical protein B0T17DRAFT_470793, partial [Bombardia bombarda]
MASLLRQIVAGPRAKHQETGLDLCYVTSQIVATSGPSQAYPQRAYRNPLDRLVAFLDAQHGGNWAIWEFRAEGTGYPDEAVYHRIRHYPWPDHHPPPFRLVPMIMAGMRNWLAGGELEGGHVTPVPPQTAEHDATTSSTGDKKKGNRVVVVHCKAGKGRSGTMACSYLISECGWTPEDALARFTARRMRPKFGAGVSIPSQLRWISYVDRWTKGGKQYVDRPIEIVEIHVWGLRHGVKVSVEGFAEEGKKIRVLHTFKREERIVVEGDAPGGNGMLDFVSDMAGYAAGDKSSSEEDYSDVVSDANSTSRNGDGDASLKPPNKRPKGSRKASLLRKISVRKVDSSQSLSKLGGGKKSKTIAMPEASQVADTSTPSSSLSNPLAPAAIPGPKTSTSTAPTQSQSTTSLQQQKPSTFSFADSSEPGGQAVIFKPTTPIAIPNSDVNIVVERRNRAPASLGLTMVTAVAHVWFNAFFEGGGPEQPGAGADDSGVFEIEWDALDGIKGSSQKGTRACDRLSVVWRVAGTGDVGEEVGEEVGGGGGVTIVEPGVDSPVPQMEAADWKGGNDEDPTASKKLGLRVADPESEGVSRASSVVSQELGGLDKESEGGKGGGEEDESLAGVKVSGPTGEEALDE